MICQSCVTSPSLHRPLTPHFLLFVHLLCLLCCSLHPILYFISSIMSDKKRPGSFLNNLTDKKLKQEKITTASHSSSSGRKNPYLSNPIDPPQRALQIFLTQARSAAQKFVPKEMKFPVQKPFCEIEARLGILTMASTQRVAASGPKHDPNSGREVRAFECSSVSNAPPCSMLSGVTRSHYMHWTQSGLSEVSPLSLALHSSKIEKLKSDIVEEERVETVYAGYQQDFRVVFPGIHPSSNKVSGKMEYKQRLAQMDLTLPAAHYDLRISAAAEKQVNDSIANEPPRGWTMKRIKRRRSYKRRDKSIAWHLDVTEVTTSYTDSTRPNDISYEIEMELSSGATLQLLNETDDAKLSKLTKYLAEQLWYMLDQINPLSDVLDVEDFLQTHPDSRAVELAKAQCGALRRYMDGSRGKSYVSPIDSREAPPASLVNVKFIGCMPKNFSRHHLDEIQRSPENSYFLSEKTDGVRHLLVFTGKTAVLLDRKMERGKQPKPRPGSNLAQDPMAPVLSLIRPGTVLDGEVVLHRKLRRPIFIVFDVLTLSTTQPILHLPFEQRLHHLKRASFRTEKADCDMFADSAVADPKVALPLVRKNFVSRFGLDDLLSRVTEERGMRTYMSGDVHNHLTDGIIFQPNLPYVCGTDDNLLKWKYLDTVTIDVEILPSDDDTLHVGVMGAEQTTVDMSDYFKKFPASERLRLEADMAETNSKIAEVGFDPTTGDWYYSTMRPDKPVPNHIGTVLGTLLELAESLTAEELRYRMSIPSGMRDTFGRDVHSMQRQMLEHQRKKIKSLSQNQSARS